MPPPILIRTTLRPDPSEMSKRGVRRSLKAGHEAQAILWEAEILPSRFKPGASYPHKPRSRAWLRRKRAGAAKGYRSKFDGRVVEGEQINIYTRRMMVELMQPGKIRAYPTRVSIRKGGPRYIKMRARFARQPDKIKELFTPTRREMQRLRTVFERAYTREARSIRSYRRHEPTG